LLCLVSGMFRIEGQLQAKDVKRKVKVNWWSKASFIPFLESAVFEGETGLFIKTEGFFCINDCSRVKAIKNSKLFANGNVSETRV